MNGFTRKSWGKAEKTSSCERCQPGILKARQTESVCRGSDTTWLIAKTLDVVKKIKWSRFADKSHRNCTKKTLNFVVSGDD